MEETKNDQFLNENKEHGASMEVSGFPTWVLIGLPSVLSRWFGGFAYMLLKFSILVVELTSKIYMFGECFYIVNVHQQRISSTKRDSIMEETQYLNLIKLILDDDGMYRTTRGGAKTRGIFGHTSRYSLKDNTLPLLTTKKMFTRGIIEELLWMLRGSTDVKELQDRDIHIWDGHSSREHLDKREPTKCLEVGDIGPGYGFQWRHAGANYVGAHGDYTGRGVDQIKNVIDSIKNDPTSRRHVVSAWSASDVDSMALPACHALFQFYVDANGLSCQLYQRSADVGLGLPYNITSYAILTHLIAKISGIKAYELVHTLGDAHVYLPHEEALREQATREPFAFPTLEIIGNPTSMDHIVAMTAKDFVIHDYKCHPKIKMDIVV
jgi:thymidylate synthase